MGVKITKFFPPRTPDVGSSYVWIPDWISYGIVLHPSGELQIVSDTEGDEGMADDMEYAAFMLVRALKRDGLLDRYWERLQRDDLSGL